MTLSENHRAFLRGQAIADEVMVGVDSEPDGIRFTLTSPTGRTIVQHRPDVVSSGSPKYRTEPGVSLVLPVPQALDFPQRLMDTDSPIVIVEGTKQHLAAASALRQLSTNYAVVGLLGCNGWMHDGGRPIPDLYEIPWAGRLVYLCLDVDVRSNPKVWAAAQTFTEVLLVELGVKEVRYVHLTGGSKDGLDDLLARSPTARRPEVMQRLLDRASVHLAKRPPRARNRFIGPDGLRVADLVQAIAADHPLAALEDQTIAVYSGGYYHSDQGAAFGARVAELLGNDFRPAHEAAARDYALRILAARGEVVPARTDRLLVNVRDGLLDPITLTLLPHTPEFLSCVQYDVTWAGGAAGCPTYDTWIEARVGADQVAGLEEMTSLMLDPTVIPMRALFLHGPTRTGKSTYARLLQDIAGAAN